MILPHTYGATLVLMILSMLCLGSWANTYKLSGKWPFELYYFDYALGLLLASLLFAFTLGNLGYDGFTFLDDVLHAGKRQWLYAFSGGVLFNLANMFLVAAISLAGMAVAFPVGMGVALIGGVVLNYLLRPAANPAFLFIGCALVAAAVIVDAFAYRALGMLRHEELAKAGLAKSTRKKAPVKAIVLALVGGLVMSAFLPLVERAQDGELGLGPYAVIVFFAAGVFFSTFALNIFFMNLPVEGDPVEFSHYFKGSPSQHVLGLLGGAIWCAGAVASFVAASANADSGAGTLSLTDSATRVGPAASYAMAQGATLIAALWGVLAWKEFKGGDTRVKALAALMFVLYACGLVMVSLAPLYVAVE
jgi:glucose uptake protein